MGSPLRAASALSFLLLAIVSCVDGKADAPSGNGGSGNGDSGSGSANSTTGGRQSGVAGAEGDGGFENLGGAAGSGGSDNQATGGDPGKPDLVSVFVAQGHMGRTVLSCDGGRTWVGEQSTVDEIRHIPAADLRCWGENIDPDPDPDQEGEPGESFELNCDEQADPGRGIAFGDGQFVATFGWGNPGRVLRSRDGTTWEVPLEGTTFGGVAYVQDTWILGGRNARRSTDGAITFSDDQDTGLKGWNVRRVGSTRGWGERVILVGEAGDAVISSDAGETWWQPSDFPASCGASIQTEGGIVSSDSVWLVIGGDGSACRSTDGGETWTASDLGQDISSHAVYDGSRFLVWSRGTLHSSVDGKSWQTTPTVPADLTLGPVAVDDEGGLVSVRGGWNVWYEDQRFYRSDDGVNWSEPESFIGSHPIRAMAHGLVPRPSVCQP